MQLKAFSKQQQLTNQKQTTNVQKKHTDRIICSLVIYRLQGQKRRRMCSTCGGVAFDIGGDTDHGEGYKNRELRKLLKYNEGSDHGIDEIAFKPPIDLTKDLNDIHISEMIVIEAKSVNDSKIILGQINHPTISGAKVRQMDDDWIRNAAQKLTDSPDPQKQKLGKVILREMNLQTRHKVKKAVVGVDKVNAEIVVQKINN
jgi:hypothetical protein